MIYSGPVNIGNDTVIRAIAYAIGKTNSAVNTAIYDFTSITPVVAPPFFDPPGGIYAATQSVTISSDTSGASIRYTMDGSVPGTNSGTLYSTPVTINSNLTLKAIAYATNLLESPINTAIYGITFAAATPAFSPPGGAYTNTQLVTMASATSDASIRYTMDGSTPTSTSGTPYSSPVTVNSNLTIKAIAYAAGATDSPVAGATYTIASPPPAFVFEAELIPFITSGAPAILQNDANNSGATGWRSKPPAADNSSNTRLQTFRRNLRHPDVVEGELATRHQQFRPGWNGFGRQSGSVFLNTDLSHHGLWHRHFHQWREP